MQELPLETLELKLLQAFSLYFYVYPHWEGYNTGKRVQKNWLQLYSDWRDDVLFVNSVCYKAPHKCGSCQSLEDLIDWHLSFGFLNTSSNQIKAQTTTARVTWQPDLTWPRPSLQLTLCFVQLFFFFRNAPFRRKKLHKSALHAPCDMQRAKLFRDKLLRWLNKFCLSTQFDFLQGLQLSFSQVCPLHIAIFHATCNVVYEKVTRKLSCTKDHIMLQKTKHDFVGQEIWKPAYD